MSDRLTVAVIVFVVIIAALSLSGLGTARQASSLPSEPALVVALEDDGSALVTLVVPFNLTTDSQRSAFQELRTNTTAREQRVDRFATRMRAIANRTEMDVGREMRIDAPALTFEERADVGIVAVSVRWQGLAARSDEQLVLSEPFASAMTLDRSFHVVAPAGYRLASVTPTPSQRSQTRAVWNAETALDGFEARFGPAEPQSALDNVPTAPGFGIAAAIAALILGVGLLLLRARDRL